MLIAVALLIAVLAGNVAANLQRPGVKTGVGFLERPAGCGMSQTLISYGEQATYMSAFVVALLNTMLVTAVAAMLATVLGFVIGIARLSSNDLVASAAGLYVESFRNIPLLILLLFWYFAVLRPLPGPRASLGLGDLIFLNNRGLFIPAPQLAEGAAAVVAAAMAGLALAVAIAVAARLARIRTGTRVHYRWLAPGALFGLPAAAWFIAGPAVLWSIPHLQGFNFIGGVAVTPELFALTVGLSIYSAAYIAEIVRSGVQAIPRGQIEAARSLGLSRWQIAPDRDSARAAHHRPATRRLLRDPAQSHAQLGHRLSGPDARLRWNSAQSDRPAGRRHADRARDLSGLGASDFESYRDGEPVAAPVGSLAMKTSPERRSSGDLLRFLRSCVSAPLNVLLTAALLALAFVALLWLVRWAVVDAVWSGTSGNDCAGHYGACWIFLAPARRRFFGGYPAPERWRVVAAIALIGAVALALRFTHRQLLRLGPLVALLAASSVAVAV